MMLVLQLKRVRLAAVVLLVLSWGLVQPELVQEELRVVVAEELVSSHKSEALVLEELL
jgi:hypothetical protein